MITLTYYTRWIPSGQVRRANVLNSANIILTPATTSREAAASVPAKVVDWFGGEKPTGSVYPAAAVRRGYARIAAGTNEVWFGGPCRGRTYGPLIKSPDEALSQSTQQNPSVVKDEDS